MSRRVAVAGLFVLLLLPGSSLLANPTEFPLERFKVVSSVHFPTTAEVGSVGDWSVKSLAFEQGSVTFNGVEIDFHGQEELFLELIQSTPLKFNLETGKLWAETSGVATASTDSLASGLAELQSSFDVHHTADGIILEGRGVTGVWNSDLFPALNGYRLAYRGVSVMTGYDLAAEEAPAECAAEVVSVPTGLLGLPAQTSTAGGGLLFLLVGLAGRGFIKRS